MFHNRNGQILKEGALTKRAFGRSILTRPLNFKERWVVLTERNISYNEVVDNVSFSKIFSCFLIKLQFSI